MTYHKILSKHLPKIGDNLEKWGIGTVRFKNKNAEGHMIESASPLCNGVLGEAADEFS